MSLTGQSSDDRKDAGGVYVAWVVIVAVLEWFVFPGLGVVLGILLAMTRYRTARPARRWGLAAFGMLVLALHVVGVVATSGGTTLHTGP